MSDKRRCFVIGPIGQPGSEERRHADMLLNAVVREVLEGDDFGYEVVRSDQVAIPGMINDKVIHDILNAELVVADLTFLNPNAFYELGIRHAALKPVIHIAQAGTSLPFDTFGHRAIIEDITDWDGIERARQQLRNAAKATEASDYKVSNPITQANASFQMQDSMDSRDQLLNSLLRRLERIEDLQQIVDHNYNLRETEPVVLARLRRIQRLLDERRDDLRDEKEMDLNMEKDMLEGRLARLHLEKKWSGSSMP